MNQELERYFNHIYRNSPTSIVPEIIPEFKNKTEIDAWFYELERKDVLFAEYIKNLRELEQKEQATIDDLVSAAKDALEEVSPEDTEDIFPLQ